MCLILGHGSREKRLMDFLIETFNQVFAKQARRPLLSPLKLWGSVLPYTEPVGFLLLVLSLISPATGSRLRLGLVGNAAALCQEMFM